MAAPGAITGSCLCEAIRYTVTFDQSSPWPPVASACQCTMCRKWTSSLIGSFIIVQPRQITPKFDSFDTYKEYSSSPGRHRGFCSSCGSSLLWRSEEHTGTFDLYVGTIDEKWLVHSPGVAQALAKPSGTQFWMMNAVPGVTDTVKGGLEYQAEGPDGLGTTQ